MDTCVDCQAEATTYCDWCSDALCDDCDSWDGCCSICREIEEEDDDDSEYPN